MSFSSPTKDKSKKISIFEEYEEDPFLIEAGEKNGNSFRMKRAIIKLEARELECSNKIKTLQKENARLKEKLIRLREKAAETERLEDKFEQLSTIIIESRVAPAQSSLTNLTTTSID